MQLRQQDIIEEIEATTRGGSRVSVLALKNRRLRQTAFTRAAARKRLLQARYLSWTAAAGQRPNLIGEGGERVVHASLLAAADAGYRVINPRGGQVSYLFNHPVPGGPLDNAAYLVAIEQGDPLIVIVLLEVKNVRHWIYPSAAELFQLLDKAARLALSHPDRLFLPVFVCRRAQYTTFNMARDLGFLVFYTDVQPLLPYAEVTDRALEEVRTELGYNLVQMDGPHEGLVKTFRTTLPNNALRIARHWSRAAPLVARHALALRNPSLPPDARRAIVEELKRQVVAALHIEGQW